MLRRVKQMYGFGGGIPPDPLGNPHPLAPSHAIGASSTLRAYKGEGEDEQRPTCVLCTHVGL